MATPTYNRGPSAYQASIKAMTNNQVMGHIETRVAQIQQMIAQRSGQPTAETLALQKQMDDVKKNMETAKDAATRAGAFTGGQSKPNGQSDDELSQIADKEMAKVLASAQLLGEKFARAGFLVKK
ncbi:unnamed protein product [Zymoseptoria tritici ST99CH_1A5]|uniref:Uncharacterized protein n=3 Tax=Zymoseptoria tritici TaxID=1047171 RepID=A0A1X7RGI2_ZYMT9|nr:unnamed protein product [Zymoseptoria tritici ST99CH_3D7]SMR42879.1 unnamed protein product [Zymoseptoria tritici ST99CH_1E4]SMR45049.1 unnamed protein product [Zymoseptoria tritici ST99CH_3D1]SMY20214.1 unnamed protein product [Zymoseptoria tritici ST99CH_1A5]